MPGATIFAAAPAPVVPIPLPFNPIGANVNSGDPTALLMNGDYSQDGVLDVVVTAGSLGNVDINLSIGGNVFPSQFTLVAPGPITACTMGQLIGTPTADIVLATGVGLVMWS